MGLGFAPSSTTLAGIISVAWHRRAGGHHVRAFRWWVPFHGARERAVRAGSGVERTDRDLRWQRSQRLSGRWWRRQSDRQRAADSDGQRRRRRCHQRQRFQHDHQQRHARSRLIQRRHFRDHEQHDHQHRDGDHHRRQRQQRNCCLRQQHRDERGRHHHRLQRGTRGRHRRSQRRQHTSPTPRQGPSPSATVPQAFSYRAIARRSATRAPSRLAMLAPVSSVFHGDGATIDSGGTITVGIAGGRDLLQRLFLHDNQHRPNCWRR